MDTRFSWVFSFWSCPQMCVPLLMAPGLMQEQFAVIVREAVEVAKAVGCDEGVDAGEGQTDCLGGNAIAIFQSRNYLMRNEVEVWAELLKRPQNVVAAAHRDPVTHAIIVAGCVLLLSASRH